MIVIPIKPDDCCNMRLVINTIFKIKQKSSQIQRYGSALKILLMHGIVFISISVTFSQSYDNKNTPDIWDEQLVDIEPSVEPGLKKTDTQSNSRRIPGYTMILDSVYEEKNFGYYTELSYWYYSYTDKYILDTVGRYFYNGTGEIQKITESRKYSSSGQLLKLVRRQPDYFMRDFYGDSTIIDYYTEEYMYKEGNLTRKTIQTKVLGLDEHIIEYYCTYDEEGRLIQDSTFTVYGSSATNSVFDYLYDSIDKLEYKIEKFNTSYSNIEKYIREETDTTLLLMKNYYSIGEEIEHLIPDTFTYWYMQKSYFITFDDLDRRKSLTVEYEDIFSGRSIQSRTVYDYTGQDDILHISYYTWEGTYEEGQWDEAMRIDNTYDEEGNILLYEKTFYDAPTEAWIIDNRKEYYYTPVSSALSTEEIEVSGLNLYPNPVDDYLHIKETIHPISSYTIYNLCGTVVSNNHPEDGIINVSRLKPGLYLIIVETESGIHTGKFVKD